MEVCIDNADSLKIDKTRLVVAGSSAGGGLAVALVHKLKDESRISRYAGIATSDVSHDR